MTVEPGRGVAVSPGGGCGFARREEPVLSVTLAGTFASSRAAQVLNPVQDQGFGEPQIRSQKDLVLIPEPVFYRGAHWGLAMYTGF